MRNDEQVILHDGSFSSSRGALITHPFSVTLGGEVSPGSSYGWRFLSSRRVCASKAKEPFLQGYTTVWEGTSFSSLTIPCAPVDF